MEIYTIINNWNPFYFFLTYLDLNLMYIIFEYWIIHNYSNNAIKITFKI